MLSDYIFKSELCAGRAVYLVTDKNTGEVFVEKILSVYNREIYEYLKREPIEGMPGIIDFYEENGRLMLIEEYIPGMNLQQLLEVHGPAPEEWVRLVAIQLCHIVIRLHSVKPPIIHRDIKPSNIILSEDGHIRLLDMNAATYACKEKKNDTVMMGTGGFAAPEQYGFEASGVSADIYAIGALMNVLLTGQFPVDRLAEGRMKRIIEKCTRMDPGRRFKSVKGVLRALEKQIW